MKIKTNKDTVRGRPRTIPDADYVKVAQATGTQAEIAEKYGWHQRHVSIVKRVWTIARRYFTGEQ